MNKLMCLLFIARIMFPMNVKVYENVVIWSKFGDMAYRLELADGREIIVPVMWTVIESKGDKK